jgi:hypothetical protein
MRGPFDKLNAQAARKVFLGRVWRGFWEISGDVLGVLVLFGMVYVLLHLPFWKM